MSSGPYHLQVRIVPLALSAAILIVGCRDKTPRPDEAPKASPQPSSDDGAVPAVPTTLRVALLDSGVQPRSALRYTLSIGDKQTVVLRLRYSATNRVRASAPAALTFPAIKLVFHLEISEALEGDRVRYRFDLGESALTDVSGADKRMVALATDALKQSQGLRGSAVIDSRGIISDGTIDFPAKLDPSMQIMVEAIRGAMEQLAVPLPKETVGLGARWEVSQTIVSGGIALDQTTIYELGKNKTGETELSGTIEQDAQMQEVELAGFETAELLSLEATGSSTATLGLDRLAPRSSSSVITSESRFEFAKKSGRRQALLSVGKTEVGVSSK